MNETRRRTSTATAAVRPNWKRKRPEMLDMNETGTKIITRLKVVAMTAKPISAVGGGGNSNGFVFLFLPLPQLFSPPLGPPFFPPYVLDSFPRSSGTCSVWRSWLW